MKSGAGLWGRIDDAINPIVVKELRQAVQSKFVAAVLLLLLTVQLAAVGIFIVSTGDIANNFDAGRDVFMILLALLLAACLIFVPAYTAVRLAFERSDTNVDLLFITTIKPRAIIAGKLLAALTLTTLIFSACMPFMVFTYWLRGIDLPSIFALLAFCFLVVTATAQLATFIACLPGSRVFKVLHGLIGLGSLPFIFGMTVGGSFQLLSSGIGSQLGSWDFWAPAGTALALGLTAIGLLFFLSVALITPLSANRALPVRLFVVGVWLASGVGVTVWSYFEKMHAPVVVWQVLGVAVFATALLVAVSEREALSLRVTRAIPRRILSRAAAFLLYSGGASGLTWSCLMTVLTLAAAWAWGRRFPTFSHSDHLVDSRAVMVGLALYAFSYSLSALFLRRWFLARVMGPRNTWLIALGLMVLGSVVPFLIGFFFFFDRWQRAEDIGGWLIGNPFALGVESRRPLYLTVAGVWAVVVALLNLPWFVAQVKAFRPPGELQKDSDPGIGPPQDVPLESKA